MSEPFNLVSVADFERMSRTEKEKYLEALVAHLQAIRQRPIGEALSLADVEMPPQRESADGKSST